MFSLEEKEARGSYSTGGVESSLLKPF